MIFNGERSIYNIYLINRMLCGLPFEPLYNTTLNEKFDIYPKYDFSDDIQRYPKINLLTIGASYLNIDNNTTRFELKSTKHRVTDGSLFNHIPFYLRKTSELLDNPPSPNYRLRKQITIDEEDYIAYYGYAIHDFSYKKDVIKISDIDKSYSNIQKFDTYDYNVLTPVPTTNIDLRNSPQSYIGDFVKLYFLFTNKEILEIKHAYDILYQDIEQPMISEMGVCSSIEIDTGYGLESVWSQINYFVDTDINIIEIIEKDIWEFYIEIGGMEILSG